MSEFKALVVKKDGEPDRIARTPSELVQFEHDGYVVVKEAPKSVAETGASAPK